MYVYVYMCVYIYIHTYTHEEPGPSAPPTVDKDDAMFDPVAYVEAAFYLDANCGLVGKLLTRKQRFCSPLRFQFAPKTQMHVS